MESWLLALLLKPVLFVLMAAAYYFVIILGLRWLYPRLPKSRFVDFLFVERANRKPDYGPTSSGSDKADCVAIAPRVGN